jgi:hypothetical protein
MKSLKFSYIYLLIAAVAVSSVAYAGGHKDGEKKHKDGDKKEYTKHDHHKHSDADHSHITKDDVLAAQKAWAKAIVAIGDAKQEGKDYKAKAAKVVDTMYAYDEGTVLFKPTKAKADQFRETEDEALSYFVGGSIPEDGGFALQTWSNVRFENHGIILDGHHAMAMGNYFFTDETSGDDVMVEYTFGYIQGENGELLINLHHSSLPYNP